MEGEEEGVVVGVKGNRAGIRLGRFFAGILICHLVVGDAVAVVVEAVG